LKIKRSYSLICSVIASFFRERTAIFTAPTPASVRFGVQKLIAGVALLIKTFQTEKLGMLPSCPFAG
jgi:hypothetical protein